MERARVVRRGNGCGRGGNGQGMTFEDIVNLNNFGFLPMCNGEAEDVSKKGCRNCSSLSKDHLALGWRLN